MSEITFLKYKKTIASLKTEANQVQPYDTEKQIYVNIQQLSYKFKMYIHFYYITYQYNLESSPNVLQSEKKNNHIPRNE